MSSYVDPMTFSVSKVFMKFHLHLTWIYVSNQRLHRGSPTRGVFSKMCSVNIQQIHRRTPMPKCDFNKVANFVEITPRHGCSPLNLLYIFRTPFPKNTPGRLLLKYETKCNFMMFWNLFIFVCCESFKVKVKTSLFIKKRLPNFTKLMKRDDKLQQLYLKAWKAKIC